MKMLNKPVVLERVRQYSIHLNIGPVVRFQEELVGHDLKANAEGDARGEPVVVINAIGI